MLGVEVTVNHDDVKDMMARLIALPEEMRVKALRPGVIAGARVIRDDARARAPVLTGVLKANIVAQMSRSGAPWDIRASVGIKKGTPARLYAHLAEFGRAATVVKSTGRRIPAARPRPFLRPAMDSNDPKVIQAVRERIIKQLDKLEAKAR